MDTPVFKLEGIIKTKEEMSDFEGPLVLILQLLSKDKIEIRDISISKILEQYLNHLDKLTEQDLDIASEFVTMASHLAYIKTKMLLSGGEEVTELEQLMSSLEQLQREDIYIQIKEVSQLLSGMYSKEGSYMTSPPEYLEPDTEYRYVHISHDLEYAILRIVGRENLYTESINPREFVSPHKVPYSIPDKIAQILETLKEIGLTSVSSLFDDNRSRQELVATLIAILELCKIGTLSLSEQDDEMIVTYTGVGRDPTIAEIAEDYNG